MKTYQNIRLTYLLSLLLSLMFISACSDEDEVISGEPSLVYFETEFEKASEGSGLRKIIVKMDKPQNGKTAVHFTLNSNAESGINGIHKTADFELLTESPIIIPKGAQQAEIELFLIEDDKFEQNLEQLHFTLKAVLSGNAEVAAYASKHTLQLEENDFELILEWDTESQNPDDANINLFVELPNHYLFSSYNDSGFEKLTLTNVNEKNEYLVNVLYAVGSSEVDFSLKCFSAGDELGQVILNGSFGKNELSKAEGKSEQLKNYRMIKSGRELKILH